MKLKKPINRLKLAALAAGLALVSPAYSATVSAPSTGDLFLGFRASGGQGASTSYLVNIGNDLTYRNAAQGSSFGITTIGDIGADLTATYGSNWNSRSDVFWGIFGTRSSVNSTVYASREQDPVGSPSLAWNALDSTGRNGTSGAITSVITDYTSSQATPNSAVGSLQSNSGAASSYNKQVATLGTTDFGSLSQWSSIEGDFGGGTSGTALDLYRIGSLGVTRTGTFTISDSGALAFAAPVPEPHAMLLGLVSVAVLGLRRHRPSAISVA